jgi:hypothetical protein
MLANCVGIADLNTALNLRLKAEILRRPANDRAMADNISGAHPHRTFNHDVRLEHAPISKDCFRPDNRKRTDLDLSAELGSLVDDGRGMNAHSTPASLKLK